MSRYLLQVDADMGGTQMAEALGEVFALGKADEGADVLLITDGEVWGTEALVEQALGQRQRVFAVGIGAAPAEGVLHRLAAATGGACDFVAPNEDAEGAIRRMFARMKGPRLGDVAVRWPVEPLWITLLPSGVFAGETVHIYAGFASRPQGGATLTAAAGTTTREATVALGTAVDLGSLVRMAAAARLPALAKDEATQLAVTHQLVTAHTNLIVVHERADGEKAEGLPVVQTVPQMLAAGWGGTGSMKRTVALECMSLDMPQLSVSARMPEYSLGDFDASFEPIAPERQRIRRSERVALFNRGLPHTPLDDFLGRFAQSFKKWQLFDPVPTFRDLKDMGLDKSIVDALYALCAQGAPEAVVMRAFFGALHDRAQALRLNRHALRHLRNMQKSASKHEDRQLREAVEHLVRDALEGHAPQHA